MISRCLFHWIFRFTGCLTRRVSKGQHLEKFRVQLFNSFRVLGITILTLNFVQCHSMEVYATTPSINLQRGDSKQLEQGEGKAV